MRRTAGRPERDRHEQARLLSVLLLVLALLVCDAGGAASPSLASAPLASVLIAGVPHVEQKPDFCGEACAEMFLRKLGSPLTQDDVFDASGLDPALGRGCYTRDLAAALVAVGFRPSPAGCQVNAAKAATELGAQFAALHGDLARGVPSIVCMHTSDRPDATEHFRLILGYDAQTDEVVYNEPAAADGAYRRMPRPEFLALWPLKYDASRWTVIRMPLEPAQVSTAARPAKAGFSNADYAQHMMELKKKMPPQGFCVVIERPFVVIGDEGAAAVKAHAEQTVRWAAARLKAAYFAKDPESIIDIWLFKDKASYDAHTQSIFGDTPTTPYGYSSSEHRALIMNIATGGGTLVHEMVHAFMNPNFPECPAWFNEGMGSLYEQSTGQDDRIVGLPNWRLPGLQKAIGEKALPTFEKLTHTTRDEFYDDDRGTHYAQARYLCYYLQEKGLLQKFYQQFRATHEKDPSGYETLKAVLGEKNERGMAAFQKRWEKFVMGLKFP